MNSRRLRGAQYGHPPPKTRVLPRKAAEAAKERPARLPLERIFARRSRAFAGSGISARSHQGLADLDKPGRRSGRYHPMVRFVLGILRALLRVSIRPELASLARAVVIPARRRYGDSEASDRLQSQGN